MRPWSGPVVGNVCLLSLLLFSVGACAPPTYDVILEHGTVIDGTGTPRFEADVALAGERIAAIGDLSARAARRRIDVTGLVVAPGFIDTHSHADRGLVREELRTNEGFLTQGVTTSVFGVDGAYAPEEIRALRSVFERQGMGTHYAFYVGHNGVRRAVMGMADREPTAEELERMKGLVREAMEEGALGLSSGLMYLPGNFASTEEVVELARVAAEYDGLYDSHIRDPAHDLIASVAECLTIGQRSGAVPHPAHHKAVGRKNFGRARAMSNLIAEARERGLEVTVDQYPYDGAATAKLIELVVPMEGMKIGEELERATEASLGEEERWEVLEGVAESWRRAFSDPQLRRRLQERTEAPPGDVFSWVKSVGYDSFRIVVSDARPEWVGRMFVEVAEEEGLEPFDLLVKLIEEDGPVAKVTLGACLEEDVRYIMTRPWTMIASDGAITGFEAGAGHPRSRGTFPRVLGHYSREQGVLTLEEAVRKMSGLPAAYLRLADRGVLREDAVADVTVFDPQTVIDRATWREPALFSEGIVHVFVAGQSALENGEVTGTCAGAFLPYGG